MNEDLNLVEILKDCPKGTKLYSYIHGDVVFAGIDNKYSQICVLVPDGNGILYPTHFYRDGRYDNSYENAECCLVPSKDQRDWSKFKVNRTKFDPKTLQPFDRVLVRDHNTSKWKINFFNYIDDGLLKCLYYSWKYVIPYNEDTKHLVGTSDEAPEYYRYWED